MARQIPTPFVYGNPPDDPGCNLNGYLFVPSGTGPFPGVVVTRAGHFSDGGLSEAYDTCIALQQAGFLVMYGDVRLMKGPPRGGPGLPGQTTDGRWHQQNEDFRILVRYMRALPQCDGFVASLGGSGSGEHSIYAALNGTEGDDMADCGVGLSGVYDASDREDDVLANPNLVPIVEDYYRSTDLPTLESRSVIALVNADQHPIYVSNGTAENMPYSQMTRLVDAMDSAGVTNYIAHTNTQDGSARHSFGTFPENKNAIIAFLNDVHSKWGGGGKPVTFGLYNLLPAPSGHIGDISSKAFLTLDSIKGCRARLQWNNIQPANSISYDWSELDAALALCQANGKKMGISVAAGCLTPGWALVGVDTLNLSADDQKVQGVTSVAAIWDSTYLNNLGDFITAFGARYDANPFVSYIVMTGFMQDEPLQYLLNDSDLAAADIIAQGDGYADTEEAFTTAAKSIIDMWFAAFPTTDALVITVDKPFSDTNGRGARVRDALLDYQTAQYGNRAGKEFTNLLATLPPHTSLTSYVPATYPNIRQPIHFSTYKFGIYGDPEPDPYPLPPQPLEDTILHALDIGANLVEVYEGDIENADPASRKVLADAAAIMAGDEIPSGQPVINSPLTAEGKSGTPLNYQITATNNPTSYNASGLENTGLQVNVVTGLISGTLDVAGVYNVTIYAANGEGQDSATLVLTIDAATGSRTPILFYPKGGRPPTPKTKPNAPTNVQVSISSQYGTTSASAQWDAPLYDGGSPITSYAGRIEGGTGTVIIGAGTNALITDLTPEDTDSFIVNAINAYGTSPDSDPAIFTVPAAAPPPPLTEPRGNYVILDNTGTGGLPNWTGSTFWDKAYIDGSHYTLYWSLLEPSFTPGQDRVYVMDDLNAYLDRCELQSKGAIISIASGIHAPQWFKDSVGAQKQYTESSPYPGTLPFPWSSFVVFTKMLQDVCRLMADRTCITGICVTGIGQFEDSIMADNPTDTATVTTGATKAHYATAVDGWLDVAERVAPTVMGNLRSAYTLVIPELPVPIGTAGKDGVAGLDALHGFMGTLPGNWGYLAYGLTSVSDTTAKRISLVNGTSAAGFAAGYRYKYVSNNPLLDPTQNPSTYDAALGFHNAWENAVALKAKFIEIFQDDADETDYITDLQDARTALAANP